MDDFIARSLPALVASALLVAAALTYPLTRLLLSTYRRALDRRMQQRVGVLRHHELPPPPSRAPVPPDLPLLAQIRARLRTTASIHFVAVVIVAIYLATVQRLAEPMTWHGWTALVLALSWPACLAAVFVVGATGQRRWSLLLTYVAVYVAFGSLFSRGTWRQALTSMSLLWLGFNLGPTLYLSAFLARKVRAVGPFVLLVSFLVTAGIVAVLGLLLAGSLLAAPLVTRLLVTGIDPALLLAALLLLGGLLATPIAVGVLSWLRATLDRGRTMREDVYLAAMVLTFVIFTSGFHLAFEGSGSLVMGLLAFPLYLALVWAFRRMTFQTVVAPPLPLLLLRVFGDRSPTEDLFRELSHHWSFAGPVTMIAGTDLAQSTTDLGDVIAFLRGAMDSLFVSDPSEFLNTFDAHPPVAGPDGRYRVGRYFCHADTWQDTVRGLVDRSAVIVMDLRLFQSERAHTGVGFELGVIRDQLAIPRTLVLPDTAGSVEATLPAVGITLADAPGIHADAREAERLTMLVAHLADICVRQAGQRTGVAIWRHHRV